MHGRINVQHTGPYDRLLTSHLNYNVNACIYGLKLNSTATIMALFIATKHIKNIACTIDNVIARPKTQRKICNVYKGKHLISIHH